MTAVASRPESVQQQRDPRDPEVRLDQLLDPESIEPLHPRDNSGMFAVRGRVDGTKVVVYCSDATKMGGALGAEGCGHIVDAIDVAVRERCPVIGVWHSGGARIPEGVESLDGMGRMFAAMIRASGRVPQISVVVGPAAGGAAYGPALTDVVIMSPAGRVFVTGPDVVRSVTGEQIDQEGLGGISAHGAKSGVVHVVADDETDAYVRARRLTGLFARPGVFDLHSVQGADDLRALLPDRPQRAYDVKPVIRGILDARADGGADFEELQAKWAANIVVGLGRLGGRSIGVIANNPLRKGGCLDSLSAEKAARFVRMCDSFGVPLLVLVDVPGYLPGVGQEWGGVVRRGAKLLHAFGEAVVPRVTLVTRKSYGGAYIAMNARSLGATTVFAWPEAEVAVMGAKAAVGILHRKTLAAAPEGEREALQAKLTEEHERVAGGVVRAMSIGVVDEVIDPKTTRRRVAEALAAAPAGRGWHGNIPL
ncbi:acyl-CoA carboxylase subunit beta [Saccharopolyspora sp. ASAGF58]|uniref:acyl-CoA carboxylase subunit beta n=1 Tax=Saccharopolyspora sp. ASAGF58 TaxID=2719023 RepID=UPI00143FE7B6|nr:carboxyl transferase domain-containing protein [Saccharopolyspora sp. ASAGF58]QIZ36497.1 acyl-CoA carboxylase subunit beta [Saccharopolyspora sp. ASAGF58]